MKVFTYSYLVYVFGHLLTCLISHFLVGHVLSHRIITKYYEAQIQLKGYKLNDILRLDTTNAEGVILITTYDKTG